MALQKEVKDVLKKKERRTKQQCHCDSFKHCDSWKIPVDINSLF